uniref:Uncharacterized protein n=2 Tax=Brassica TaxID=3705 RepID=A0A0D3DFH2_BRAOL
MINSSVAVVVTLSLWSQGSLSKKSGLDKCSYGIIESCKPSLSNACDQSLKKALIDCSKREEIKECSNNLSLRTLFSLEFTSKLEISAEEIVSCYELPESLDKHLQCPHTGAKGGSDLNWDPIDMFCSYLKKSNSKTSNATDAMDWFEVDIGLKQAFLGSLRGEAETNTCQERLKLDGWLSSSLFKEQFPNHLLKY